MKHPNGNYYKYSYGEAKVKAIEDAEIINGIAETDLQSYQFGPRMSREMAVKYYNKKLEPYWLDSLDERIPLNKRKKVLDYLLGNIDDEVAD